MELSGARVLVIGAGKSGVAVSRFLIAKGACVELTDIRNDENFSNSLKPLEALGIKLTLGHYPPVQPGSYTLVVVSPGVPLTISPVIQAHEINIPVIGELELAYRFARAPVVAVTGTNGKTTTTALIGEIFKNDGFNTLVAGNIGLPLVEEVEKYTNKDIIVAEVSSFQLETTRLFRPCVGVILNITPDHLDRHGTMENYIKAKARIFANQEPENYCVLNYDDPLTRMLAGYCASKVIFFSSKHALPTGVFVHNGEIIVGYEGQTFSIMPAEELKIPGAHNLENALAATACGWVMGVQASSLARTLQTFTGVVHRLEFVREVNGVRYINDSKGTNPEASIRALQAFKEPIVLLAGGKNKGNDFTKFAGCIKEKVCMLILFGQSADEIEKAARLAGVSCIARVHSLREAVLLAYRVAQPGEIVLLSPACASWDMFGNYEERGNLFKQMVMEL